MRFVCQVSESNGIWKGEHSSADIGPIKVTASTHEGVLKKLEGEIRYWLEMCPCSGHSMRHLTIELVESN